MKDRAFHATTVVIATFIPWLILLAAMGASVELPRLVVIGLHYALAVLLFAVAFATYFRWHQKSDPFTVMVAAVISLFIFDIVYTQWVSTTSALPWAFTYVDWIVPVFFIGTTVYGVGRFVNGKG